MNQPLRIDPFKSRRPWSGAYIPAIIRLPRSHRPIPYGATLPDDFDFDTVQTDYSILMECIWFTTPKRIHGIWHYEGPNQLFFAGYECKNCQQIFLVPDSVQEESDLLEAMRHECMEPR